MGTLNGSNNFASVRKRWDKVFDSLVDMIKTQKTQIECLAEERKLFEDRIKLQQERFQDQISRMNTEIGIQEMVRNVEAAYSDFMVGQKQREAFSYKFKLDDTVSELADFRAWLDHFSSKCSDTNENSPQVLALLAERDFVWNQYKMREKDLTDRLKDKSREVEQVNEQIQKLLSSMERLQSSNSELEEASVKKSEEISRLSRELELLKKGGSVSTTPVLRRCSARSRSNEGNDARNISLKKESHPSRVVEKVSRSSKRTALEPIPTSEIPKLFTSAFKVPKLKNSSPCVI
ncbi:hypothetical protein Vadar_006129 [Vaccinium darrowii]|uniref:Uncharacterized protein n=1 Tax=Vaccinium darrowii TaxID=229202 RepID=A0ACB7Y6T8_9ERIC|nr:hypothetical protein Vadar_006129 [Vaccinium darrowii]